MNKFIKKIQHYISEKKNSEISEIQKIKYDVYLRDREYLVGQKHRVEERESNLLILLSTGIFSLFFAFFSFVPSFVCVEIIFAAKIFSVFALFFILFSLIYSKRSFDTEIDIRDILYGNENFGEKKVLPKNNNSKKLRLLLLLSRISIIIAVTLGLIFYSLNLKDMGNSTSYVDRGEPSIKTNEPASRPLPIIKEDK